MIKRFLQKTVDWLSTRFAVIFPIGYWVAVSRNMVGATIEILPKSGTPLAVEATTVRVPCDNVIFPYVAAKHSWQSSEGEMLAEQTSADKKYVLLDIGANIGLFSRQLLAREPRIQAAFCYEPETANFRNLEHNLRPFGDRVRMFNRAISSSSERKELFIDLENIGNYSLTGSAMEGRKHKTVVIETTAAAEVQKAICEKLGSRRIIWKSDTQGYDLFIASQFSEEFWKHVDIALFELWRISGPALDEKRFASIAQEFSRRCFVSNPAASLSVSEIIEFIHSNDGRAEDLLMIR
jgi:FkbM family methyltransferase